MQQEAQQKNITLVRKPRRAVSFISRKFVSSAEGLEMRWDTRIQAWEIVTQGGRVEFRIGRVVNGQVLITFYVTDTEPQADDLSRRAADFMSNLIAAGVDLGEWEQPVAAEKETSNG